RKNLKGGTMKRLIIASLLAFSTAASASFYTGNQLLAHLESKHADENVYAMGQIVGVTAALSDHGYFCLPDKVTVKQITDITQAYLTTSPKHRHVQSEVLI